MRFSEGGVLFGLLGVLGFPAAPLGADGNMGPVASTTKQPASAQKAVTQPASPRQNPKQPAARLTAAQIVQKNLAARGGAQAWQGVQSMTWKGKIEVGYGDSLARSERWVSDATTRRGRGPRTQPVNDEAAHKEQVRVPFALEMKRPDKTRIEVEFGGKTAVQLFDGSSGWLLRPYLNRDDWEPYSAEQAAQARSQQSRWNLGGPLIDSTSRGAKVELIGVEPVEGHDAYKLELTEKAGEVQHVWIDAKSFLDVKVEGTPRRVDGKMRTVWVTQRDFRSVQGVMVPFMLDTAVEGAPDTHKMIVEKVTINPRLDDSRFVKPKA